MTYKIERALSEVTMLSRMLVRYTITLELRPATHANGERSIRLVTVDARLDTTAVYEGWQGEGVAGVIVRAYNEFRDEYEQ